jgi:flagellar hook assembly protein FlgD
VLIGALGVGCVIDAVTEDTVPSHHTLDQNYPNPFNPVTNIQFALPRQQQVKLFIYSLAGRRVATLIDGEMPAGIHSISWNGCDDRGRALSSGSYIYRLSAGEYSEARRMMLIR